MVLENICILCNAFKREAVILTTDLQNCKTIVCVLKRKNREHADANGPSTCMNLSRR